jgi:hypothetical protein
MSTDQLTERRPAQPRGEAKLVGYDEYINTQVETTRRLVKVVDLATSLVVLVAGVLAYLLAVAIVEHWLVPGGFPVLVRAVLFALLAGGVAYFAYRRLWPPLIHAINPVYAAQAIEQSAPTLKNSLINLLLFRQHRGEISEAVYRTLEEQAAQRLTRIPVESAVDRSLLVRCGYVLLVVVAIGSLYKVLSPKDPIVAARRVLMPWAEIVPASRVTIADVTPGTVTVSRGEFVDVSARVRGIGENDPVLLRFTTEDGQAVNKPIPMRLSKDGFRFETRLPAGDERAASLGVAQNLRYRIEAGDARSLDYQVRVVPAPSILVERIEYEYPEYTGFDDRVIEGLGDIRAIEGTRVTIHARANGPIKEAHVDFDADGRRDLRMTAEGNQARASFVLALREDRQTPKHASYVLRFANAEDRTNRDPVKYPIHVEPDLTPEVAIRNPQEKERQVRLDETVTIEVDAIDPDFALAEVRLHGHAASRVAIDEPLLEREHTGRFAARFQFTPGRHDLRAGDVVKYWATANDNRTPQAGVAKSEEKIFRITSPDAAKQPPPDHLAQRDPQQGEQQPQDQPGQQGQQEEGGQQDGGEQQDGGGQQQPQPGQGGEPQPGAAGGEADRAQDQQPQDGQQQGQPGGQNDRQGEGEAQPNANERNQEGEMGREGEGESLDGKQQGAPGDRQPQDAAQRDPQAKPGDPGANGKQTGAGQPGGESSPPLPGDARPDGARGEGAGEQASADAERAPISSEGDHDAEAFQRIQRHLQERGELPEEGSDAADAADEPSGRDAQPSAEQEGETGRQAEGEISDSDATGQEEHAQDDRRADERSDERGEAGTRQPDKPGAETRGDNLEQRDQQSPEAQDGDKSPGGEETSSKGPAGAGEEQQAQGASDSQQMKPGEKRESARAEDEQTDQTEPPAGARGKKESDSRGEQGGDRAGGGEEGGGQDAPRDGTGSAGQNQAADEGAGESTEQGPGNDAQQAGRDAPSQQRTGEAGEETPGRGGEQEGQTGRGGEGEGRDAGAGEDQQPLSPDAQPSADEREGETGRPREGEQGGEEDAAQSQREARENANQRGTATGGGGEEGAAAGEPPRSEGTAPEGDEANLEYARKQTDLVLEKLADRLKNKEVDDRLLEDLGWSEEDLRQFIERWQSRKEAAQQQDETGEAARRELDEALRSLGLRRGPLQQARVKEDSLRDLREGYRGPVPLEYRERLRAYSEGVSRSRGNGQ